MDAFGIAHSRTLPSLQATDTIVNPVPAPGTFKNLTSTITSNPSVGIPVVAAGYCCMNVKSMPCPTDANSPLLVACTSTTGPVYFVSDLLAYKNGASGEVGLGMSVSNGGPPSTLPYNDYEIGAACAMHREDARCTDACALCFLQTITTSFPSALATCWPARCCFQVSP